MDRLTPLVFSFGSRFLSRELKDARDRWRRGLKGEQPGLSILITVVSMYVLWQWAFGQGFLFGLSFLTAAILAILRGHILTHPFRLILVALAAVIGTFVIPGLRGDAWEALRGGDVIGAVCHRGGMHTPMEIEEANGNWADGLRPTTSLQTESQLTAKIEP